MQKSLSVFLIFVLCCCLLLTGCNTTEKKEDTMAKNYEYPVTDFGAKGDGSDDTAAIQKAIDAAKEAGGGTVFLPKGRYGISSSLKKHASVSIRGEGMWLSTLLWISKEDGTILDTANEALWGTTVSDLGFATQETSCSVIGILGGSTLEKYNSAIGRFENLLFNGLDVGICGNAEPEGVGIFDCFFENIFCTQCEIGLQLFGSGNTLTHPRMANNKQALVLDYLNGESFDGIHVIGGIFAANGTDITVAGQKGIRPCNFVGTWFETSKDGILTVSNPGTPVMNLTFRDCMLHSNRTEPFAIMDFSNAIGTVCLDSCTLVGNSNITPPKDKTSSLIRRNLTLPGGIYEYDNDREKGHFRATPEKGQTEFVIPHNLKTVPSFVNLTPASSATAAAYYVEADEKEIRVIFRTPPTEEIAFYWLVDR
ncbi:MAG: hypothetical protein IJC85_00070 [Oscillospiraceae bacterium]|nr:hypothetical protein [Oscillospiraceae bacterium]